MKKRKKKNIIKDYVKACRRNAREEEILLHGKLISTVPTKVASSKKDYKRTDKSWKNYE